jgi:hypothetical protein
VENETDLLAFQLLQTFAAALRDLSEGKPIPAHWRNRLDRELGPRKNRGRPGIERVMERDLSIARRVLSHYLSVENGAEKKKITQYVNELAEEYALKGRAFETKDVFRIYKRHRIQVLAEEAGRRLRARDEADRRLSGESSAKVSSDYPSRRLAIIRWLNSGMNLGVHHDPVPVANLNTAQSLGLVPAVPKRR